MPRTIILDEPLVTTGRLRRTKELTILQIRGIKVKDILGIDFSTPANANANMLIVASRVTNISIQDLSNMNLADWNKLATALSEMLTQAHAKAQ